MLRTGRGAGVARPYKWHIYGHTAWVSKTTLFRGRMPPPQTFDVHRSDLRDAIYAKIEKSIYRGAGIARLYITTYIRAPGMGKQDHPFPGVVCPQTLDLHRSDIGDAICAKIENLIYRGAGIARPYITTYIRAPGMGKQDHPLPGVACPPNFGSPSIRPLGRYICKNRKIDLYMYICRSANPV